MEITFILYVFQLPALLKLLGYCIKVRVNRKALLDPSLRAVPVLMGCLKLALDAAGGSGGEDICEPLLQILECLLVEAASESKNVNDYVEVGNKFNNTLEIKSYY